MEKAKLTIYYGEKERKAMKLMVQYNPSSLKISSSAGGVPLTGKDSKKGSSEIEQLVSPAQVSLSVDLLFARSEYDDEIIPNQYKVKAVMNALLYLLSDRNMGNVEFAWGNMAFLGQLVRVNNQFNMFDSTGEPIRGKSSIEIEQIEKASEIEKKWENLVNTLSKDSQNDSKSQGSKDGKKSRDKKILDRISELLKSDK